MLASTAIATTMAVEITVSRRLGHTIFAASARTCWRNAKGLNLSAIKGSRIIGARASASARAGLGWVHKAFEKDSQARISDQVQKRGLSRKPLRNQWPPGAIFVRFVGWQG